jgi:hypothetical protein
LFDDILVLAMIRLKTRDILFIGVIIIFEIANVIFDAIDITLNI